jgi:hypothetical protein
MTEIPSKDIILNAHSKIQGLFLDGFKDEIKSHLDANHTFLFGKNKSIWRITENLGIDKEIAIYILMGSNRRQENWGKMEEKFELQPLRRILTPMLVELAREVDKSHYYQISFTDSEKLDGNFKLRVDIKPLTKKEETTENKNKFTLVKSKFEKRIEKNPNILIEKLRNEIDLQKARVSLLEKRIRKD